MRAPLYCLATIAIWIVSVSAISSKSVTYPGIGTFSSTDFFHPIYRPFTIAYLPEAPEEIEPTFLLYTPANREVNETLPFNDTVSISSTHFRGDLPTKVFTHGYRDEASSGSWMVDMKNRLLHGEDLNVLIVDWSKGASGLYSQAAVNARLIGAMIGIQIGLLSETTGAPLDSFHLLGHSLGAHVLAYAGKRLNGALGRISGLDPAGPFFRGLQPEARLWPSDAQFVDVIHTDGMIQGMLETCGHVDFYPNGGAKQPGCIDDGLTGIFNSFACNHGRAYQLYIDSLNHSVTPLAHECSNYVKFRRGKCADCGEGGERCAILGLRAIEAKGKTEPGRRFYLNSNAERPLFS